MENLFRSSTNGLWRTGVNLKSNLNPTAVRTQQSGWGVGPPQRHISLGMGVSDRAQGFGLIALDVRHSICSGTTTTRDSHCKSTLNILIFSCRILPGSNTSGYTVEWELSYPAMLGSSRITSRPDEIFELFAGYTGHHL
jgi:hypothetical protein